MAWLEHKYPKPIKILDDPYITHQTAMISLPTVVQPTINDLLVRIYRQLFMHIVNNEWPITRSEFPTRMTDQHKNVKLDSLVLDTSQRAVSVDIARAGMVPSQVFTDELFNVINEKAIRQDHIFASRVTDAKGAVTGTHLADSKIGGDIDGAIVMIPDPMGATGSSICEVISHYKDKVEGTAKKFIAAHMIITPEYIKKLTETHPDVLVYAARLDRGFSTEAALAEVPGTLWDQEKGLDDNQYIVPGAGGVGELVNNAFV